MATIDSAVKAAKQRFSLVGQAPQFVAALERAIQVAPFDDCTVLILGESGAGKEAFPQVIHANSPRKHKKYISVNCGAIPEGTADSELFGHMKGAYTGALNDHKGYFEECDGGTIFLDEVAELPLETQAKLLRVLECGEFMRMGSNEVRKTDVRVIAATNKDVSQAVKEGKFRKDLYHRISTVEINIPPLRERGNDIMLLCRRFANLFSDKYHRGGIEFNDAARTMLLNYLWPGNVRQLRNVMKRVVIFEGSENVNSDIVITAEKLSNYMPAGELVAPGQTLEADYSKDRIAIFQMLVRHQQEINELKKVLAEGKPINAGEFTAHLNDGISDIQRQSKHLVDFNSEREEANTFADYEPAENTISNAQESAATFEEVHTPKTLEDTERETIMRALERNMGRRKKTAEELHISERTLYRKIKQYKMEQNVRKEGAIDD